VYFFFILDGAGDVQALRDGLAIGDDGSDDELLAPLHGRSSWPPPRRIVFTLCERGREVFIDLPPRDWGTLQRRAENDWTRTIDSSYL
jgi:hypothetical protein